jgi:tetratricopeptide (TPR) repeat protein
MRIAELYRHALLAMLIAGASGATLYAQTPKATPAPAASSSSEAANTSTLETIPVTTNSAIARSDYEAGVHELNDLLFIEKGLDSYRAAVKADPHFALAHAMLAFSTMDPAEGEKHRARAKEWMSTASPDEQLLIRFLNGTRDGRMVPAIAAMNDLFARYPNDKSFANMASAWLCSNQLQFERGSTILERLLAKDPNYAPAMNNIAYCYALGGRAKLAPPWMERYVLAMPDQPNPLDSYGEILRMLGRFDAALEHYEAADKMATGFSQIGISTTYALMGDQERARAEYQKSIEMEKDAATKLNDQILQAMTYFRENKLVEGRKAYMALGAQAHKDGRFPVAEAETHRSMALFNPDAKGAMRDLLAAELVLSEKHVLSKDEHDTELATILQTRAYLAVQNGSKAEAQRALAPLSAMAATSRSNPVQNSFHSANGAVMLLEGRYAFAVAEFQEDSRNPLSLRMLSEAETKAGMSAAGQEVLEKLAAINDERVESAVAVPQARAALKAAAQTTAQASQ